MNARKMLAALQNGGLELRGAETTTQKPDPLATLRPERSIWEAVQSHSTELAAMLEQNPGIAETIDKILLGCCRFADTRTIRDDALIIDDDVRTDVDGTITLLLRA